MDRHPSEGAPDLVDTGATAACGAPSRAVARDRTARFEEMALYIREAYRLFDCRLQTYVFASPAYARIWGHGAEQLYTDRHAWLAVIHPEDRHQVLEAFERVRQHGGNWAGEYRLTLPNGTLRWVADRFFLLAEGRDAGRRIVAIAEEITDRRTAEEENCRRQKYVESVLYNAPDAIVTLDPQHLVVDWNPGAVSVFGYEAREAVGKELDSLIGRPPVMDKAMEKTRHLLAGNRVEPFEGVRYRKDGSAVNVIVAGSPILINDVLVGAVAVYTNITVLKQVERALRESTEQMRTVFYTIPDPMALVRLADMVCVEVNEAFITANGFAREAVIGRKAGELPIWADPGDLDKILDLLAKYGEIRNQSIAFRGRDGRRIESLISARVLTLDERPHFLFIARDISALSAAQAEKERLEGQLCQAHKMEAIGTLAGGIAHDFNNLLAGIQGRSSLMLNDIHNIHPFYEHLRAIEAYVERAAALTRQLLGFARGGRYEVRPVDLNAIVAQSLALFSRARKELDIKARYDKAVPTVEADPTQIEQVLLNIFINAWQAMPDGGSLLVETADCQLEESEAASCGLAPGRYVRLTITDSGVGMEAAVCERVFDPFFTTKPPGQGSGLGLASAYGIIQNHGGGIRVASVPGEGSTFTIYLPPSLQTPQPVQWTTPQALRRGNETLLLVDDEEMILDVSCEMLKRMGYTVLSAAGGSEALALFQEHGERIALVILDMIMPGMSGAELFRRMRALRPQVAVLISSGYSIEAQAEKLIEQGCRGFIQKPFNMEQLSEKLRQVLDDLVEDNK